MRRAAAGEVLAAVAVAAEQVEARGLGPVPVLALEHPEQA